MGRELRRVRRRAQFSFKAPSPTCENETSHATSPHEKGYGKRKSRQKGLVTADVARGTTGKDGGRVASDYIVNVMGLLGKV